MMKKLLAAAVLVGVAAFGITLALRSDSAPSWMPGHSVSSAPSGSDSGASTEPATMAEPTSKTARPPVSRTLMADKNTPSVERVVLTDNLRGVVKPLLNSGTDLSMAADGFHSRQDFVATAYAAKNLDIPFVVLKDRIVTRNESLSKAISELKPTVNASLEANRAAAEARAELAGQR